MTEYVSWEKEKVDSLPKILNFKKGEVSQNSGILFNNFNQLKGSFKLIPNNVGGAEVVIENIKPDEKDYKNNRTIYFTL